MSAIRRAARSCALSILSFLVAVTGSLGVALVAAPAEAADGDTSRRVSSRLQSAQSIALNQRGDAYRYGAAGPNAFDCSGLIYYSYRRAGLSVPRTSSAQAGATRRVAKHNMRPGDLMFFYGSGGVYHAAIFLRWERGRAVMVHSPSTGSRVHVSRAWTSSWFGGTLRR